MELFQINWDDNKNLFLEFKKNKEEKLKLRPETVKKLNIQFNISKIEKQQTFSEELPSLISIRKFYFSENTISFSIDLDELNTIDDIQIEFICLIIFLDSGQRKEVPINKKFQMYDICNTQEYYIECENVESEMEGGRDFYVEQENFNSKIKNNFQKNNKKYINRYKKIRSQNNKKSSKNRSNVKFLIRDGYERLKKVEKQVNEMKIMLKNMSSRNFNSISQAPPRRMMQQGIIRIKRKTQSRKLSIKLPFLEELKDKLSKFNEEGNIQSILKPMTNEELKAITLDNDELKEKEAEFVNRQIEKEKKKITEKQDKEICLENQS